MRIFLLFFLFSLINNQIFASDKTIYGYVEKATLVDKNLTLSAKLDTGAKSASLNARNIKKITKNNEEYLSFVVPGEDGDVAFECKYVGHVSIKLRTEEKDIISEDSTKRPMVLMPIKIANKEKLIRVNLANRKRFAYPLLLGRQSIVAFDGIVDPSLKYNVG